MENEDFDLEKKLNDIYNGLSSNPAEWLHKKIGVVNISDNPIPEYESDGASGFDIRANLPDGPITLGSLERTIVKTGLFFELPLGFELQVRPRSGLAAKKGVTVLNSPGTVDADYRGEVGVILVNLSKEDFTIEHGDRIAQGVIAQSLAGKGYKLIEIDKLSETKRGSGGFGSTGVK
jgi:dUTP pyrophosphatase